MNLRSVICLYRSDRYLVLPPYVPHSLTRHALKPGVATSLREEDLPSFPRLRAYVNAAAVTAFPGAPTTPLISVSLCNAYDFGGESLQYLAQALKTFGDKGGERVKEALHANMGIRLLAPKHSASVQLSVKDSLSRFTTTSFGPHCFRPSYIVVSATDMESCRAFVLTLVEVLHWVVPPSGFNGMFFSSAIVGIPDLSALRPCIQAVRYLVNFADVTQLMPPSIS